MALETVIRWHTSKEPDPVLSSFIRSAIGSNRRMRHARFEIAEPDDCDLDGSISIERQDPHRMIDPNQVREILDACMD